MTITEKKNFIQMRGNFRQLNISGSICLEFFFVVEEQFIWQSNLKKGRG